MVHACMVGTPRQAHHNAMSIAKQPQSWCSNAGAFSVVRPFFCILPIEQVLYCRNSGLYYGLASATLLLYSKPVLGLWVVAYLVIQGKRKLLNIYCSSLEHANCLQHFKSQQKQSDCMKVQLLPNACLTSSFDNLLKELCPTETQNLWRTSPAAPAIKPNVLIWTSSLQSISRRGIPLRLRYGWGVGAEKQAQLISHDSNQPRKQMDPNAVAYKVASS